MWSGYAAAVEAAGNYHSGDDYVVEFLGYSFSFSSQDFEERVTAAAVRLGLVSDPELDEDETADLVELTAGQLNPQEHGEEGLFVMIVHLDFGDVRALARHIVNDRVR